MDLLHLVLTQPSVMLCLIDVCVPNAYLDFILQTVSHVSTCTFQRSSIEQHIIIYIHLLTILATIPRFFNWNTLPSFLYLDRPKHKCRTCCHRVRSGMCSSVFIFLFTVFSLPSKHFRRLWKCKKHDKRCKRCPVTGFIYG